MPTCAVHTGSLARKGAAWVFFMVVGYNGTRGREGKRCMYGTP